MDKQTMNSSNDDLDVEALLANMDDDDEVIEESAAPEIEEDVVEEEETVDLAPEEETALESDLEVMSIYEEAAAAAEPEGELEAAPEAKTKRERKAPAPRTARSIEELDANVFILTSEVVSDPVANKAAVIARKPSQVKVAEKFDNLLLALDAGKAPSAYTMKAFKILDAEKSISSADLAKKLEATGMNISTARSQAGQMMSLFPALQIAVRSGKMLTINEDSILAEALRLL